MLKLALQPATTADYKVLCLGAHSDDIEIGCGGTILRLARTYQNLAVNWVVFSANGPRAAEAQASAQAFLAPLKTRQVRLNQFRDGYFPFNGAEIKDYFEQLKKEIASPDLILTHYHDDLHQDHRLISSLTWNTFRDHLILEYEIPKYDGDLGNPNFFVQLDEATARQKTAYILQHFPTQSGKQWFSEDTFLALMRLRGIAANAPGRYAEGFYLRKAVF
jgi:LmbE family N-acetylglucosaminyl deacetylase